MTSLETLVLQKRQGDAEVADWSPRTELGKIFGLETDLSTLDDAAFIRTVATEISEALPDRVVEGPLTSKLAIARHAKLSYAGLLDPIAFSQAGDRSSRISTSLGGHPDIVTHFSTTANDDVVIRREQVVYNGGEVHVLPDEASETSLAYTEYLDALALDLAGACRELIEMDPEQLPDDDQRALRLAR